MIVSTEVWALIFKPGPKLILTESHRLVLGLMAGSELPHEVGGHREADEGRNDNGLHDCELQQLWRQPQLLQLWRPTQLLQLWRPPQLLQLSKAGTSISGNNCSNSQRGFFFLVKKQNFWKFLSEDLSVAPMDEHQSDSVRKKVVKLCNKNIVFD